MGWFKPIPKPFAVDPTAKVEWMFTAGRSLTAGQFGKNLELTVTSGTLDHYRRLFSEMEAAMRIRDLLNKLKDLPGDTPVCIAEIDEAFAVNIASVEVVEDAKLQDEQATGREAVELADGRDRVVVIRW